MGGNRTGRAFDLALKWKERSGGRRRFLVKKGVSKQFIRHARGQRKYWDSSLGSGTMAHAKREGADGQKVSRRQVLQQD